MTKEELATKITGMEYGSDIEESVLEEAKASGLIIIYGHSDDLIEFEGALEDEAGAYGGGAAPIYKRRDGGLAIMDENQLEDLLDLANEIDIHIKVPRVKIKAISPATDVEAMWHIKTDLPFANFDIMEDGDLFCRGIIISKADVLTKLAQ